MSVNSKMKAIADAIRAKTGGTAALTLDGMAEAVAGIEAGGGDDLAKAIVEKTVTEVNDASIKKVENTVFSSCYSLTSVNLPSCASVGTSAFSNCWSLASVDLPACTSVGTSAFSNCSVLASVGLPACTSVGEGALSGCSVLASVGLPACTSVGNNAFGSCISLASVDLPVCTRVGTSAFSYCSRLTSVVIRTESMCALTNKNAFDGCRHILGIVGSSNPEGLKDGYIYVPDALVEDYKAATNWSTYASQIKPLSEYVEVTA